MSPISSATRRLLLSNTALVVAAFLLLAGAVPAQLVAFTENFGNGNSNGWTLQGEWQIGPATASPSTGFPPLVWNGDPGYDGDGVAAGGIAGIVIGGNATNSPRPPEYLTSPVIALPPGATSTLSFKRWNNSGLNALTHTVDVFNGTTWVTVFSNNFSQDSTWQLETIDVTSYANLGFRVRFGMWTPLFGGSSVSSWNLDNVRVTTNAALETIVNGGFEQIESPHAPSLTGTFGAGATDITGWSILSGSIDRYSGGTGWTASEGQTSIDLSGQSPGEIAQTIHVRPNKLYRVDFAMAGNIFQPGLKTLEASATINDANVSSVTQQYSFDSTGMSASSMGWATKSLSFSTAGATSQLVAVTLKFKSLTSGASGAALDDLSFAGGQANVPEAALVVNGTGTSFVAGPWAQELPTNQLTLTWYGFPNAPFILIGSFAHASRSQVLCLGSLDIGTPAMSFSDVFIILDGTSFPGSYLFSLDGSGTHSAAFSTAGMPAGTEVAIQGLVAQPAGASCPFLLTAAHVLVKP